MNTCHGQFLAGGVGVTGRFAGALSPLAKLSYNEGFEAACMGLQSGRLKPRINKRLSEARGQLAASSRRIHSGFSPSGGCKDCRDWF